MKKTEDMKQYASELVKMHKSQNDDEPYGNLSLAYKEVYENYKNTARF